ncbi:MAG: hypothetical protein MUC69_06965 [Gemmatimonadales bacterium]|nr:hypothetical protein [Gemmatimonadales bacterium]
MGEPQGAVVGEHAVSTQTLELPHVRELVGQQAGRVVGEATAHVDGVAQRDGRKPGRDGQHGVLHQPHPVERHPGQEGRGVAPLVVGERPAARAVHHATEGGERGAHQRTTQPAER